MHRRTLLLLLLLGVIYGVSELMPPTTMALVFASCTEPWTFLAKTH